MSERSAFVRAWHAWRHTPLPVASFREGRASAPAYEVELVLDHLASSIYSRGMAAMEGRAWDFGALCGHLLGELETAAGLLEALSPDARAPYRTWIDQSRALLDALAAWQGAAVHP